MDRAPELDEVNALVEIAIHRGSERVGAHQDQVFPRPFSDVVVELLLPERGRLGLPECRREESAPAHDVSGDIEPRTDHSAPFDGVPDREQRFQNPVAVANRGNAVLEVELRALERDVEPLILIADVRLHASAEGDMNVGIDEARRQKLAGPIEPAGAARHRDAGPWAHRLDPGAAHQHRRIGERRSAVAVDHGGADDGGRAGGRLGQTWDDDADGDGERQNKPAHRDTPRGCGERMGCRDGIVGHVGLQQHLLGAGRRAGRQQRQQEQNRFYLISRHI